MSLIQKNIPVPLFEIENLSPGVAVFSFSFISLFSATLISKDRTTSLLMRLFASPMKPSDYILGYIIPLFPIALAQSVSCFLFSMFFGLRPSVELLVTFATLIPSAVMFIGIGLICGTVFNDKAVGGICGALLTNVCGWLSGTWFSLDLVGGAFKKVAYLLPFANAVDAAKAALAGNYSEIFPKLWWVIGYAIVAMTAAVLLFGRKIKKL